MLLKDAYSEYIKKLEQDDSTTVNAYRGKVKKFIVAFQDQEDAEIALTKINLEEFIFKNDQKCLDKYSALSNFCIFVFKDLLHKENYEFPIDRNQVIKYDEEFKKTNTFNVGRKTSDITYLDDDFDFSELFNDSYYSHINNDIVELTIKAIIGLGLTSGFDSQHFFKNRTNNYLRISDFRIENENEVYILYTSKTNYISEILVAGDLCEYLIRYAEYRRKFESNSDAFFIRMWKGRDLKLYPQYYNNKVADKPDTVQTLVLYFLRYISDQLNIAPLKITDLRYNMVYHHLLNSKGAALHEIIRLYGFMPFVQSAFERYTSKINEGIYTCYDFFKQASSLKEDTILDDGAELKTRKGYFERRIRDSGKVKKIKQIYNNKCQICGDSITFIEEYEYSEVHHIQPIGGEHKGPDEIHNMLVLCPNHHTIFDLGLVSIDPTRPNILLHIDKKNLLNNTEITLKHNLSTTCIRYHYEKIFLPLIKTLNPDRE